MTYFFAWLAAIGFGFETIFGKLTSKHTPADPWIFNFTYPLIILLFTIPIALINHATIPSYWTALIFAGLFQSLAFVFFVLALFKLDVSLFSPLFNFRSIFSVLLGAIFLGEVLNFQQYIIVGVIFLAGLFVSMDEKFSFKSFFSTSVALLIIDTFFWSLTSIFISKAAEVEDYWTISLWSAIIGQIFLLGTIPLFYKKLKETKVKDYTGVFVMAIAGVIGTLASTKAFLGNVGISTVIMSLPMSMIIAFGLSFIAPSLLEKHSMKVYIIRFSAAAIMVTGAILLGQ